MSNEVYAFALKSTLDEIQNACPDVTSNFVFKDGKIIAKNKTTTEEDATQTIRAFDAITERADALGDVENITIQSAKGKVNIANMNDFYVTTVSSKEADEKYVNTLTRILIPIVIKLSEKIQPASTDNETETLDQTEPGPEEDYADEATEETYAKDDTTEETADETEETNETDEAEDQSNQTYYEEKEEETASIEPETYEEPEQAEPEPEYDDEPLLPEPPVTQLIVENLGGLLVPSDTVRVDQDIIKQWNELYGDNKIKEVEVEALNGKTTRCKFKNIKKSKDSGKGIIKMPEKIQLTLETQQGELVTVKPVIE
jgi:predicted regulator of Ras-like GTPase activity (Roadblock/LC7/MglB family)